MRKLFLLALCVCTAFSFLQAQEKFEIRNPEIIQGVFHGETVALKDFKPDPNFPHEITKTAKPGYHPKKDWPLHEKVNPLALPQGADPAWQQEYSTGGVQKALVQNYDGQGYTAVDPSDPTIDVGPNHVIQMINAGSGARFQVYDKAGNSLSGPNQFDTFFGLPGGKGDPIVLYDELADRWLMSEFSNVGNMFLIAVSTTPDPLGTWFTYTFTAPMFPDYPKYSVWPQGYFITTNESTPAIYALDRTQMLAGLPATMQRFVTPNYPTIDFQSTTPVSLKGATLPPAGTPAMFMRMADDAWSAAIPADRLEIYELTADFAVPANSVFTGPTFLPTTPFDTELNGYTAFAAFPQPGSSITLDPLREVLMYQVQYRNFGTHESMVCNHVTDVDGFDRGGIRWYELRRVGAGPWTIFQEGTYSPDTDSRWMGAISINAAGDIGLMYNITSTSTFPGIRYTGRRVCDPPGVMSEPETTIVAGSAANSSNRYGDYNALSVDPSDGLTFWGTAQYNATSNWSTRIASFDITPCCDLKIIGISTTDEICPDAEDGTITITAATSAGPITYSISGPVSQSNGTGIFTGLPSGNYSITVTDTGVANCDATDSAIINPGVDNTPPVLVCPANITVPCDKLDQLAVTGEATATDNCDPAPLVTFEDLILSGDCEWECTIQRTWTATDKYANSSTCVQTIVSSAQPLVETALASPMIVGRSFHTVRLDVADAACIIDWMPASGATASSLERDKALVGADCLPGDNALDINGKIANPLFAQGLELALKVRLNPDFGNTLLSETGCTIHDVLFQYMNTNPTINSLLELTNLGLGNIIGPPHLQYLLEAVTCVNDLFQICDSVNGSFSMSMPLAPSPPHSLTPSPKVRVFPNPTAGLVNVDLSGYSGKPVRMEIYNMQGVMLYQITLDESQQIEAVDLSARPEGLYLLRLKSEGFPDVTSRIVLNGR